MRTTLLAVGCLVLLVASASDADEIAAITRPSEDVTLSFVRSGKIAKLLVIEGAVVKTGQLLVQLDDAAERMQLVQLEAEAKDTVHIRAAEANLKQKQVDLEKLEEAFRKKAVSKWDVEHARLDVTIKEMSLELAKFEHEQAALKFREAQLQLERMRMPSPIDGRVEKIVVKQGESADALEDVLRIVDIDPLWIDVPVPLAEARRLKCGDKATVTFPNDARPPAAGDVIHIGAVADAASDTLTVRVQLPNTEQRPAGEQVRVRFDRKQ